MTQFERYVTTVVVRKHLRQTMQFNLSPAMWGNVDLMLKRIRKELLETARLYRGKETTKFRVIDFAIEEIRFYYTNESLIYADD